MVFDFNSVVDLISIFKDVDEISLIFFSFKNRSRGYLIRSRSIYNELDLEILRTKCRPFESTKRVLRRQVFSRERKREGEEGSEEWEEERERDTWETIARKALI